MSSGAALIEGLIKTKAVLVVAISECGRSRKIKEVFDSYDINKDMYEVLHIDGREDTNILQFYMGQKTGASSVLSAQCSVPRRGRCPGCS